MMETTWFRIKRTASPSFYLRLPFFKAMRWPRGDKRYLIRIDMGRWEIRIGQGV